MKKLLFLLLCLIHITTLSWSQDNGNNMFDVSVIHRIDITFEQENFWDSLEYYYNENDDDIPYMMADVMIDGSYLDSIGIREKGNYSNYGADGSLKKPLKLKFNKYVKGQKYDGLKKINLQNGFDDPSMLRDHLSYKFMRESGIPALRSSYAKVYINNTYWGLYIVVEQVDKKFLSRHFDDNDGNLFKCRDLTNLEYQGDHQNGYTDEFEQKTNDDNLDYVQLIKWIDVINNSGAELKDSLEVYFETSKYLKVLAADIIMLNWDSYYDHGRNFYVYQNPENQKINWIPWDYNLSFSATMTDIVVEFMIFNEKLLVQNIQQDESLKQEYFGQLCDLMDYFNLGNMEAYIDNIAQLIRPDLDQDPNKFYSIEDFDKNIDTTVHGINAAYPGIKQFIRERNVDVIQQLNDHNYSCFVSVDEKPAVMEVKLYPNPSTGYFTVELSNKSGSKPSEIVIFDVMGKIVYKNHTIATQTVIDINSWKSGLYLCLVSFESGTVMKKLMVH